MRRQAIRGICPDCRAPFVVEFDPTVDLNRSTLTSLLYWQFPCEACGKVVEFQTPGFIDPKTVSVTRVQLKLARLAE